MLTKIRRISRKEFPEILKNGDRRNSPHLLLYLYKTRLNKKNENSKFSFSISKKVCPNAVERNKYRRRAYSIINKHKNLIKSGYYCLFVFKKGSNLIKFKILETEILELLSVSSVLL